MAYELDLDQFQKELASVTFKDAPNKLQTFEKKETKPEIEISDDYLAELKRVKPQTVTDFRNDEENIQNFEKVIGYMNENESLSGLLDFSTTGDTDPVEFLRDENIRIGTMFNRAMMVSDAPEDVKEAYRKLRSKFADAEVTGVGEYLNAFADYGTDVIVNPETIATVAATIFSGGTAAAGTTTVKAGAREALKQALTKAGGVLTTSNAKTAGAYTGVFGGLSDLSSQGLEISLDEREEYNPLQTAAVTGLSAVAGAGATKLLNNLSTRKAVNALDETSPTATASVPEEELAKSEALFTSRQQRRAAERAEAKGAESARKSVKTFTPKDDTVTVEGDVDYLSTLTSASGNKLKRDEYLNLLDEKEALEKSPLVVNKKGTKGRAAKKEALQEKQNKLDALQSKIDAHEEAAKAEAELSRIEQGRLKLLKGETPSESEQVALSKAGIETPVIDDVIYNPKIIDDLDVETPEAIVESPAVQSAVKAVGGGKATMEEVEHAAIVASQTPNPRANFAHKMKILFSEATAKSVGKAAGSFSPYVDMSPTAKKLQGLFAHEFAQGFKQKTKEAGAVAKDFFENQQIIQGNYFEKFKVSVEEIAKNRMDGTLDSAVNTSLNNALRGIKTESKAVNAAALRIKELYSEMGTALKDAGIIKHKLEDYVPRMWNRNALERNQDEFAALLVKHKEAKSIEDAQQIVAGMLNKKNQIDAGTGGHFFSAKRTFNNITSENEAEFIKFINDDVVLSMQQYVTQASRSLAKVQTFGVRDIKGFNKKYIARINKEVLESRGTPLSKVEQERLLDVYRSQTGEELEGFTGKLAIGVDAYGLMNRLAYLPLATLSSLTEVMLNITKGGVQNSVKGFGAATELSFKRVFKRGHQDLIDKFGMTTEEAWREMNRHGIAIEQGLAQMDNRLSGEELATEGMQKASNAFFKVTLLDQWTKFAQATSFYSGKNLIHENIKELAELGAKAGTTSRSKKQIDELLELGIDVDKAVNWFKGGAKTEDAFYEEILGGAARFTNEVILQTTSTSGLKSKWMSNPKSAWLFQLMSYPAAFTNTVLKNMAKTVSKDKKQAVPIIMNGMLITAAARGINYIRTNGESEEAENPNWDAIKRWGGNGLFFDLVERARDTAMYSQSYATAPLAFLGVVGGDVSKLMNSSVVETVGQKVPGYAAGKLVLGEDAMDNYRKFLKKTDKKLKKKLTPQFPSNYGRENFFEGGKVDLPVPQAPLDPSTRIDKMTGLPYNMQASRQQFAVGGFVGKAVTGLAKVIDDATGNVFSPDVVTRTANKIQGFEDDEALELAIEETYERTLDGDMLDVPDDMEMEEYLESLIVTDFADIQHSKKTAELVDTEDYDAFLKSKGFSEQQIQANALRQELEEEIDPDLGISFDTINAMSELRDAYAKLGGHRPEAVTPKNKDTSVYDYIKNELSKKDEGKLLSPEGVDAYASRYLKEIEEDARLKDSLERILNTFPSSTKPSDMFEELAEESTLISPKEFTKDSAVKVPVYRAVSEYQDLDYDIAFALPREIGVHVGTEGQAAQMALLAADADKFSQIAGQSTVAKSEYDRLFSEIQSSDAPVSITKGYIDIKKPLVLEDEDVVSQFNTFEAEDIMFMGQDDSIDLMHFIEDDIAEQAGKSLSEIKKGLDKVNNLQSTLLELQAESFDDGFDKRLLDFKQDVIKAQINVEFREWLKSLGFDSIKYKNVKERSMPNEEEYSYILFEPQQFKSFSNFNLRDEGERSAFFEGGYVIQSGDTLSSIAERNNTTVEELQKLNAIEDADKIYAGQKLKFNPVQEQQEEAAPEPVRMPEEKEAPIVVEQKEERPDGFFDSLVPANVQGIVRDVATSFLPQSMKPDIDESILNNKEKEALRATVMQAMREGRDYITYEDYLNVEKGASAQSDLQGDFKYDKEKTANIRDNADNAAEKVFGGVAEPLYSMKTLIGRARFNVDDDGNVIVEDEYDFNDATGVYRGVNFLKDAVEAIKEDKGAYHWMRNVIAKNLGSAPGTGAKVTLNLGKIDSQEVESGLRKIGDTTEYIVQKGDSLSKIAEKVGVDLKDLIEKNSITDPDKLQINQKLKV